ncbi:MAG: D-alanyl-D-alanine carboxypeptidase/D-alanyl-D-alanine-endopeptidase [Flavobacteriales bacterium]|nr:D-alanyl-D-alanine carboxypeptidase/D-alanyl-D-alanine-endopeptidase [Flavobacteriales bacterium]
MVSASKLFITASCLLASVALTGQNSLSKLVNDPAMKGASLSLSLIDVNTGELLMSHEPSTRLCPASVWKIFTASAALENLGEEFKFRTLICHDGTLEDGVLNGNIYIIGSGDPSLGSKHFDKNFTALMRDWVDAVKAFGIRQINGKVVANGSFVKGISLPRTRIWEDMGNYYGTAVSGININDNSYSVFFNTPMEPGGATTISRIHPEVPGLQMENEVIASTVNRDRAYIFGSPLDQKRFVRGTLPVGRQDFEVKGSLPEPLLFSAFHFKESLNAAGVTVKDGITVERETHREPSTLKRISATESPELKALLAHTLQKSDNLYAEAILMQLGARNGEASIDSGLDAIHAHTRNICESSYAYFAYDGSGLSRFTAVSSAQVTQLLHFMANDENQRKYLLNELPVAGKNGTMRSFGRRTNLEGNLRAKTGSMERVRAYAGTLTAFTGRELGFAILVNNYEQDDYLVKESIQDFLLKVYGDY